MNVAMSLLIHGEAVRFNRGRGDKEYDFKYMEGAGQKLPYVSAQCYKKHWREALPQPWSPVIIPQSRKKEGKSANQGYTAGDPIKFLDDDLFGYMIAGAEDVSEGGEDTDEIEVPEEDEPAGSTRSSKKEDTPKRETTRRTAPVRMHAPVAFSGIRLAKDFQTLSRHLAYSGGDAVLNPNPPSFYSGWLKTRVIIEASRVGKFYIGKNLDILDDQTSGLEVLTEPDPYSRDGSVVRFVQLPDSERRKRVRIALEALANIGNNRGPSSSALHDGSLRPQAFIGAFMTCADSPFDFVWQGTSDRPRINMSALTAAVLDYEDLFAHRTIYIGLPIDEDPEQESELVTLFTTLSEKLKGENKGPIEVKVGTVRRTLLEFSAAAETI
jgi:CRISPR-associated protein Cst2